MVAYRVVLTVQRGKRCVPPICDALGSSALMLSACMSLYVRACVGAGQSLNFARILTYKISYRSKVGVLSSDYYLLE